jgi:hypothetical protein
VPMTAQDRVRRGPFGALLILLSLFLSSGAAAAAGNDLHEPLARLAPSRHGAATAVLPSGTRNPLDDEATDSGGGPAVPASGAGLVTERLWARPLADAPSGDRAALPRPASASYRARAPPAA